MSRGVPDPGSGPDGDTDAENDTDTDRRLVERAGGPTDRPRLTLDVREAGPPAPLVRTLETLAEADAGTVLLQRNDRAPQHLYPKLDDRGYEYGTVDLGDEVVTVVWTP